MRPPHPKATGGDPAHAGTVSRMKKIIELLLCFLHPLAVILIWVDLLGRRNISTMAKVAWAIFSLIPLVPFLYVLTGGDLW
jgi:membrane protein YdbS with pleckstrin-like domain